MKVVRNGFVYFRKITALRVVYFPAVAARCRGYEV